MKMLDFYFYKNIMIENVASRRKRRGYICEKAK